ncbi:hypothetical protein NCCP2331_11500 [Sporosarcina sp. NCCP-2331]|nr:hypothetical protein NCCP2331_11500 [Sporosarcina sp. NCCP-2331]GLB56632.1 hypothetical protein NCCP2378_24190 [Sporosarcina sp. NCCP-2378]
MYAVKNEVWHAAIPVLIPPKKDCPERNFTSRTVCDLIVSVHTLCCLIGIIHTPDPDNGISDKTDEHKHE